MTLFLCTLLDWTQDSCVSQSPFPPFLRNSTPHLDTIMTYYSGIANQHVLYSCELKLNLSSYNRLLSCEALLSCLIVN